MTGRTSGRTVHHVRMADRRFEPARVVQRCGHPAEGPREQQHGHRRHPQQRRCDQRNVRVDRPDRAEHPEADRPAAPPVERRARRRRSRSVRSASRDDARAIANPSTTRPSRRSGPRSPTRAPRRPTARHEVGQAPDPRVVPECRRPRHGHRSAGGEPAARSDPRIITSSGARNKSRHDRSTGSNATAYPIDGPRRPVSSRRRTIARHLTARSTKA